MARYVVNTVSQANGDHEVHVEGCAWFPEYVAELGDHAGCATAVAQARNYYGTANGCSYCAPDCHTR